MLRLEDLTPGMELKGTVVNVVPFGAFVDIGLKDTGLVHISRMANKFIKNPYEVVGVGDVVSVWVVEVDNERKRASLTMVAPGQERKPQPRPAFTAPPPRPPRPDRPDRPAPPRPPRLAGPPPRAAAGPRRPLPEAGTATAAEPGPSRPAARLHQPPPRAAQEAGQAEAAAEALDRRPVRQVAARVVRRAGGVLQDEGRAHAAAEAEEARRHRAPPSERRRPGVSKMG